MSENEKKSDLRASYNGTKLIVVTAVLTALTTLATAVFQISFTISEGYFNLGESMIYIAAFVFGPYVGAFAGGVGASLADVFTGYVIWAPGTLAIKCIEGFVVGLIFAQLKKNVARKPEPTAKEQLRLLLLGFIVSLIIVVLGSQYVPEGLLFWIILSFIFIIATLAGIFWININTYPFVYSVAIGAIFMVTGYLIYGYFVVVGFGAFAEIPINILQCLLGLFVAIPVYQALYKGNLLDSFSLYQKIPKKEDSN